MSARFSASESQYGRHRLLKLARRPITSSWTSADGRHADDCTPVRPSKIDCHACAMPTKRTDTVRRLSNCFHIVLADASATNGRCAVLFFLAAHLQSNFDTWLGQVVCLSQQSSPDLDPGPLRQCLSLLSSRLEVYTDGVTGPRPGLSHLQAQLRQTSAQSAVQCLDEICEGHVLGDTQPTSETVFTRKFDSYEQHCPGS